LQLKYLKLTGFRNLEDLEIELGPAGNLLVGDNGAGKTNIAEAAYLLNIGQSFRARKQNELINWQQEYAWIKGGVLSSGQEDELQIILSRDGHKKITRNGNPISQGELVAAWNIVLFSPEDVAIIRGAPRLRRRC